MRILIKNGHIIDPDHMDGPGDLLIEGDSIAWVYPAGEAPEPPAGDSQQTTRIIDAEGKIVVPGLIDLHVHLREPGQEYKETVATGCRAAAAGGITAVVSMPNTDPVNDNGQVTEFILSQAEAARAARVYPVGAVSVGLKGESLAEFHDLKTSGAVAVSDDGCPVNDAQMMRRAMEYAKGFDLVVMPHCEVPELVGAGVMNEGTVSAQLGLPGIPNAAESVMVMRDIALCELTGGRLHICHVSTAESVQAIREGKAKGVHVTAETAPHYFTLTDADVGQYDTHAKMNPPLRSEADRLAIIEGLRDGTLDAIATDHAPHTSLEKDVEFEYAANGIIGLETSLPVSMQLVRDGHISMVDLVRLMAVNPARILGLEHGLRPGLPADVTIIDPDREWTVDAGQFESLSRNCPFDGWTLTGRAVFTIVDGRVVYELPE